MRRCPPACCRIVGAAVTHEHLSPGVECEGEAARASARHAGAIGDPFSDENSNDFQSEEDTAWPAWADGAALTSMASARMCFIAIPFPWCDSAAKSIARSILAEVCLEAVDRAQQSEVVGAVLSGARSWLGGHWVVACFQLFKRARSGPQVASRSPSIAVSGTRTTAGPVNDVCPRMLATAGDQRPS